MSDFFDQHAESLLSALFGGGLVWLLGFVREIFKDDATLRSLRDALRGEVEVCGEYANTFLTDGIPAPLYRLPSTIFSTAFPDLLRSGVLGADSARALIVFYAEVATLNRGLDDAARYFAPNAAVGTNTRDDTVARNRLKAGRLRQPAGDHYWKALEAVS